MPKQSRSWSSKGARSSSAPAGTSRSASVPATREATLAVVPVGSSGSLEEAAQQALARANALALELVERRAQWIEHGDLRADKEILRLQELHEQYLQQYLRLRAQLAAALPE